MPQEVISEQLEMAFLSCGPYLMEQSSPRGDNVDNSGIIPEYWCVQFLEDMQKWLKALTKSGQSTKDMT